MHLPTDTHETDDDYVENPAKHYDGVPLVAAALCPGCKSIRPMKMFQRYMTPGEAKYRGYDPMAKVLIETEKCSDCRPAKRTDPEDFTPAELRRKAELGHLPATLAEGVAQEKLRRARTAARGAVENRWNEVRMAKWDALIDAVNAELDAVMKQDSYAKRRGGKEKVSTYANTYKGILRTIRAAMKVARRRKKVQPEHDRWQDYLTDYERNQIAAVWNDIDFVFRQQGMRPPGAFAPERGGEIVVPNPKPYENVGAPDAPRKPSDPYDNSEWDIDLTKPEPQN